MQRDARDAAASLVLWTSSLNAGCSIPALPAPRDPLPCLRPRAYGADVGKTSKIEDPQLREISWKEMSQQGEQQGKVVLWMKCISLRWFPSPSLLQ